MMQFPLSKDKLDNMTVGHNSSICNKPGDNASLTESYQMTTLVYIAPELVDMIFVSFGNILVLLSVRKFPELQTTTNIYVVNLAVADLSIGLFVLPLQIIIHIFPFLESVFLVCMFRYYVTIASIGTSALTLVFISIDRYIAIEKPYSYITIMTSRRSKIICAVVWGFMLIYAALPLLGWNHWSPCSVCTFSVVLPTGYITVAMVTIISFVVVVGLLNAKIFLTANAISRDIQKQEASVAGQCNDRTQRNLFLKNKKAAKVLFMVFGVFAVCTLPFSVFTFWVAYAVNEKSRERYNFVRIISTFLVMANSGMNPVIYHRRIPQFNAAFRKLLGIKPKVEPTMT